MTRTFFSEWLISTLTLSDIKVKYFVTMNLQCANNQCRLASLTPSEGRVEIKAALPAESEWASIDKTSMSVKWKSNGEATFHTQCWTTVLKLAKQPYKVKGPKNKATKKSGNGELTMQQWEKLMVRNAAKTLERFDSLDDVKIAANKAAALIRDACHCIAFTGAGISTSAGLGDFRGKSGKWTAEDQTAVGDAIQAAFHSSTSSSCVVSPGESASKPGEKRKIAGSSDIGDNSASILEPSVKRLKSCQEQDQTDQSQEEDEEEIVDYENLRPTYTHEALSLLIEQNLLHYIISQNCDGLHLLSGINPNHLSELHGNVFVEKCPKCQKRYSRDFYVMHDKASQYYEEMEDHGKTEIKKPKFAVQCDLCGLCHRTGRRCEQKGCKGYLEDTIINFRDHLEDSGLDRALEEAGKSEVILCLGTTLMVTPACDIVEEANGKLPLIICNRQKTAKDDLAKVRVFGNCDVFMREVLTHLLSAEHRTRWEEERGQRMKGYNSKRQTDPSPDDHSDLCDVSKKKKVKTKSKK